MEKQKDEQTGSMLYSPSMPGQKLGQALPISSMKFSFCAQKKDADGNLAPLLETAGDYNFTAKNTSGALTCTNKRTWPAIHSKIVSATQQYTYPPNKEQYGIHLVQRNTSSTSSLVRPD